MPDHWGVRGTLNAGNKTVTSEAMAKAMAAWRIPVPYRL
jgi:hypothetical protein